MGRAERRQLRPASSVSISSRLPAARRVPPVGPCARSRVGEHPPDPCGRRRRGRRRSRRSRDPGLGGSDAGGDPVTLRAQCSAPIAVPVPRGSGRAGVAPPRGLAPAGRWRRSFGRGSAGGALFPPGPEHHRVHVEVVVPAVVDVLLVAAAEVANPLLGYLHDPGMRAARRTSGRARRGRSSRRTTGAPRPATRSTRDRGGWWLVEDEHVGPLDRHAAEDEPRRLSPDSWPSRFFASSPEKRTRPISPRMKPRVRPPQKPAIQSSAVCPGDSKRAS